MTETIDPTQTWSMMIRLFLLMTLSTSFLSTKTNSLKLKLHHRFSPSTPFSAIGGFENFTSRMFEHEKNYVNQRFEFRPGGNTLVPPLSLYGHFYFVKLYIGQPPVEQYLAMDTGSSVVWVLAVTGNKKSQYFPNKSSTHRYMRCNDKCYLPSFYCRPGSRTCSFSTTYADKTTADGYASYEQFQFDTDIEGSRITLHDVVFGACVTGKGSIFNNPEVNGVFGLSPLEPSFVYALDALGPRKFSYCIGNIWDPKFALNQLTLGEGAETVGDSTPLISYHAHYNVGIQTIFLGEEFLDIDKSLFGEVVIDSASVLTWLPDKAYEIVASAVAHQFKNVSGFYELGYKPGHLCYQDVNVKSISTCIPNFPTLALNFFGGASLQLGVESLFAPENIGFCMTIAKSTSPSRTIIGITSQQNHTMGFDLVERKLFIYKSDCQEIYYK